MAEVRQQQTEEYQFPKFIEIAIQILILYSVVTFSIETFPDNKDSTVRFLYWNELVIVVIFSIEYLIRLFRSPNHFRFLFSVKGLVDLVAILPFYLGFLVDLRSIRIIRIFRIVRLLKLTRYSKAIERFQKAFTLVFEEFVLFISATIVLIYLSAVGIYYFENQAQPEHFKSIFHSLWWAVATLTTVGYGDVFPVTVGGKIFTFAILMLGLGMVSAPAGLIASALTKVRADEVND